MVTQKPHRLMCISYRRPQVGTPADAPRLVPSGRSVPTRKEPLLKNTLSCLALGIRLLTGTLFAYGQTPSPRLVAQAPVTVPPSGVLVTQPPAPVAVPPSGVLVTQPMKRRNVATAPVKTAQTVRTAERATPVTMRRHVRHRRTAATTAAAAHGDDEQNAGKGMTQNNGPLPGKVETSFPGLDVSAIQGKLKLPRQERLPQE